MATEQVKLAVIGVGAMGSLHARDILKFPNTELVAVCDTNPQRAETIAQSCGCKKFSDYRKMLDQTDLDGVIIATPHNGHPPIDNRLPAARLSRTDRKTDRNKFSRCTKNGQCLSRCSE